MLFGKYEIKTPQSLVKKNPTTPQKNPQYHKTMKNPEKWGQLEVLLSVRLLQVSLRKMWYPKNYEVDTEMIL